MSRTNYYLNDIALQNRMRGVMERLIHQYPFTHQGTFGGFRRATPCGMGSSGGSSGGRRRMKRGGEDRNMDRPNGQREIGRWGYGGSYSGGRKRKARKAPMRRRRGGIVESPFDDPVLKRLLGRKAPRGGRKMKPMPRETPELLDMGMPSARRRMAAGMSGGKRKGNSKWIAHVKAYAKKHGISYGEAMKKARSTYRG
jgi:hypothetical protein